MSTFCMATVLDKPDVAEVQDQAEGCSHSNSSGTRAGKDVDAGSPFIGHAGGDAQQAGHMKGTSSFGQSHIQQQDSSRSDCLLGQDTPSHKLSSAMLASCSTCIAGNSSGDCAAPAPPAAATMQQQEQHQQQQHQQHGHGLPSASSSHSDPSGSVSSRGTSSASTANSNDALMINLSTPAATLGSSSGGTTAAAGDVTGATQTAATGATEAQHPDDDGGTEVGSSGPVARVGVGMSSMRLQDAAAAVAAEPAGPEGQGAAGVGVEGTDLVQQPVAIDQQQLEQQQGEQDAEQEQGQGQEEPVDQADAVQGPDAGQQQQQPAVQPPQQGDLGNFYNFWIANMAPAPAPAPAALPAPSPNPFAAPLAGINQPDQQDAAEAAFEEDYAAFAAALPNNALQQQQQQQQQQVVFPEHIPVATLGVTLLGINLATNLGIGSFGSVHLATYLGDWVAVKLLQDTPQLGVVWTDELRLSKLAQEVNMLERAKRYNPRVVGVRAVIAQPGYYGIIMDACDSGLLTRIQEWQRRDQAAPLFPGWQPEPSWPVMQSLLREAAQTLWDLHNRGILHNDLRAANFLLKAGFRGWELRLCDFGLAAVDAGAAAAAAAAAVAAGQGAAGGAAGAAAGGVAAGPAGAASAAGGAGGQAAVAVGAAPSARVQQATNHLWRAPELVADEDRMFTVTAATDMYALGCTFDEMMTGRVNIPPLVWPPPAEAPQKQVPEPEQEWHRALPRPMPDLLRHQVQLCFSNDPMLRPTAQQLATALQQQQQHPFLVPLGLAIAG